MQILGTSDAREAKKDRPKQKSRIIVYKCKPNIIYSLPGKLAMQD